MLHCSLHLTGLALPSAKSKDRHLRPIVQGEGGVHRAGDQLQTDVVDCERLPRELLTNVHKGMYARINIYRYRTYNRMNLYRIHPDQGD